MAISSKMQELINEITKECERLTMDNVEVYDVQGRSPLTDLVIVATATHILQLEAARRTLSLITKTAGYPLQNPTEDYSEGWLVMDCVDLVIHILIEEKRAFYDLDGLMKSVKRPANDASLDLDDIQEPTDAELEEILANLTPEELEEFLANTEVEEDEN
ncbi:MAG: ribosome silencing factor [Brevinema sp.]